MLCTDCVILFVDSIVGASSKDTYLYRFKHVESFDCWGPDYSFCVGSCCHGSELPFVFNVFTDGVRFVALAFDVLST